MPAKLKVFRTPIGFHDAYVAAPSQKAALEAWGSDANLFARGAAEAVTDPALMAEPLAIPGKVIRRARGSTAQHLAALPKDKVKPKSPSPIEPESKAKVRPPPSRTKIDRLERQIETLRSGFEAEQSAFRQREKALAAERRQRATAHERAVAALEDRLDAERQHYARAIEDWRE